MFTRHDGGPAQKARPTKQTLHGAAARSDFEILRDVQAILADPRRSPEGNNIDVSVREGVVTLRGTTLYPRDRAVVRRIVGRIPGVVAVGCDLRAREPEPTAPSTPRFEPAWV
jgi:osmotically-inducible protein OsmY